VGPSLRSVVAGRVTIRNSLLTSDFPLLTTHYFPLAFPYSPLTTSLLAFLPTPHSTTSHSPFPYSPLTTFHSLFPYSPLTTSLLAFLPTPHSLLFHSPFPYSPLTTSLLAFPLLATHQFPLAFLSTSTRLSPTHHSPLLAFPLLATHHFPLPFSLLSLAFSRFTGKTAGFTDLSFLLGGRRLPCGAYRGSFVEN
jgi:hypothetical protein